MRSAPFILDGEIDISAAGRVKDELLAYAQEVGGAADLVVDCTSLTFIDSIGLAALVAVRTETKRALILKGVPDNCRRVFEITGLDEVFELE